MEDFALKVASMILDKVGFPGLLGAVFLALYVVELRRHESTRKELATERSARVDDLRATLPVIQSSTAASQTTAAGLATMTDAVRDLGLLVRELALSSGRGAQL